MTIKPRRKRRKGDEVLLEWLNRLSPTWIKVILLGLPVAGLFLISYYIFSLTPVSMITNPIYAVSFAVFFVVGRLMFPIRIGIHGHVKERGSNLGWPSFIIFALIVVILAQTSDIFLPATNAFAGITMSMGLFAVYVGALKGRIKYCHTCAGPRHFLKYRGEWLCTLCGNQAMNDEDR